MNRLDLDLEVQIRKSAEIAEPLSQANTLWTIRALLAELDAVRAERAEALRRPQYINHQVDCPRCGYERGLP